MKSVEKSPLKILGTLAFAGVRQQMVGKKVVRDIVLTLTTPILVDPRQTKMHGRYWLSARVRQASQRQRLSRTKDFWCASSTRTQLAQTNPKHLRTFLGRHTPSVSASNTAKSSPTETEAFTNQS
jgi:hypothetical protein